MIRFILLAILIVFGNATNPVQNDNFQVKRKEYMQERRTMLQERAQQHLKGVKMQHKQMLESRIHLLENRYAQIEKMQNAVPERQRQRYTLQGEHLSNTISKMRQRIESLEI